MEFLKINYLLELNFQHLYYLFEKYYCSNKKFNNQATVRSSLKYKWSAGIYHSSSAISSLFIKIIITSYSNYKFINTFQILQFHLKYYFLPKFFPYQLVCLIFSRYMRQRAHLNLYIFLKFHLLFLHSEPNNNNSYFFKNIK